MRERRDEGSLEEIQQKEYFKNTLKIELSDVITP